jgi:hypothetical protein
VPCRRPSILRFQKRPRRRSCVCCKHGEPHACNRYTPGTPCTPATPGGSLDLTRAPWRSSGGAALSISRSAKRVLLSPEGPRVSAFVGTLFSGCGPHARCAMLRGNFRLARKLPPRAETSAVAFGQPIAMSALFVAGAERCARFAAGRVSGLPVMPCCARSCIRARSVRLSLCVHLRVAARRSPARALRSRPRRMPTAHR